MDQNLLLVHSYLVNIVVKCLFGLSDPQKSKDLFDRTQNLSRTMELLFPKMPKFTTNEKFLENFVLIFAKDNTDCFLFCN